MTDLGRPAGAAAQPRGRRREPLPRSTSHTAWRPAHVLSLGPWSSSHLASCPSPAILLVLCRFPCLSPSPRRTRLAQGLGSGQALLSGRPHSLVDLIEADDLTFVLREQLPNLCLSQVAPLN